MKKIKKEKKEKKKGILSYLYMNFDAYAFGVF